MQLLISDKCLALVEVVSEFYPEARWQRCVAYFYRNVFSVVAKGKVKDIAVMLKAIHARQDSNEAVHEHQTPGRTQSRGDGRSRLGR